MFATAAVVLRAKLFGRGRPVIVWVQDLYTLGLRETGEGNRLVAWITRLIESATLRAADRTVVIHERFADFVKEELGVSPSKVHVIRNWTHLSPREPIGMAEARVRLGWAPHARIALHAGNMGAKQGLENLVDAARLADERADDIVFVLLGDGAERRRLEAQAEGVARIKFMAPLSDDDFRLALEAADVLLVNERPGVAAMAVPSKLTSYFDSARPVVAATDPKGITASEVESARAGVVVPAGAPRLLLEAVLNTLSDPEEAGRSGQRGRDYRERVLDETTALREWSELIDATHTVRWSRESSRLTRATRSWRPTTRH